MSVKCIILVMMKLICLTLSLITILSITSNIPEEDSIEVLQYKLVLIVYSCFCVILIALILNPVQGTSMLYPCLISIAAILIWIAHVTSLTFTHIYIWNQRKKYPPNFRELRYNNRATFLTFGYVNIVMYTLICISIVSDTISLFFMQNSRDLNLAT